MATGRRGTRWVAALLGTVLVATAVVVYALIRITASPTDQTGQSLSAATSSGSRPPATAVTDGEITGTPSDPASSSGATSAGSTRTSMSAQQSSTPPTLGTTQIPQNPLPSPTNVVDTSGTRSDGSAATTSVLTGSLVPLPAAWTGTAQVTIAQTGDCPGDTPTRYSGPADVAVDVAGGGAGATDSTTSGAATAGSEPTLTIGVNTAGVPSVAVYSATVDDSGVFHRFWSLSVSQAGARTDIGGSVIDDDALDGNNPNLLVDALPAPAGCPDPPATGLPRVLALGSTLTGWLDAGNARFTLKAKTADGQRSLTVTIRATRSH